MDNFNLTSFCADFMSAAQFPSSNGDGQHLPPLTAIPPLSYAQHRPLPFQYPANNIPLHVPYVEPPTNNIPPHVPYVEPQANNIPRHVPYVEPPANNMYLPQDLLHLDQPPLLVEPSTSNNGVDMTQGSSSVSFHAEPNNSWVDLPPGYKFNPKDEELILYYLMKKVSNQPLPCNYIIDVDVYEFTPWDLAEILKLSGDKKGFLFTPRDRRYPKGQRPNRRAKDGYWKASGADQKIKYNHRKPYHDNVYGDIVYGDIIGTKRALVFYRGSASKGEKTQWIMHEYDLYKKDLQPSHEKGTGKDMRLGGCVLCSVYYKGMGKTLKGSSQHDNVNKPMGTMDFNHNDDDVHASPSSTEYMQEVKPLLDISSSLESSTIDGGSESSRVPPNNSANQIHNDNVDSFEDNVMKFVNG